MKSTFLVIIVPKAMIFGQNGQNRPNRLFELKKIKIGKLTPGIHCIPGVKLTRYTLRLHLNTLLTWFYYRVSYPKSYATAFNISVIHTP